jgi:hypothetical protein
MLCSCRVYVAAFAMPFIRELIKNTGNETRRRIIDSLEYVGKSNLLSQTNNHICQNDLKLRRFARKEKTCLFN